MNKRTAFVFLFVLVFALVSVSLSPLSERVRAQGQLAFGAQRFPAIGIDKNDNLYLTMSVATAPASEGRPHSQTFFTMSRNGGANWDNLPITRNLSKSKGEAFGPAIAVTKRGTPRVYIAYHDNSTGTTQAHLVRSKKKTKFRGAQNITPHDGGTFSPRVALDSNETVYIVWGDLKDGSRAAFVRSADLGETFSEPIFVSGSSTGAFDPEIAVDSNDAINVVWEDSASGVSAIMFARSTDGGETFTEPKQVSTGTGRATEAHVATDSANRISVVWVQEVDGTSQAFYSRSIDGGQTFSEPVNVSNFSNGDIHKPLLATYQDSTVYIAFQNGDLFGDNTVRNPQVYLVKSNDAGVSFSEQVQISNANNNEGRAHSPAIAVDSSGVLHIAWIDASIIGGNKDEGLLVYANTTNGRTLSNKQVILATMII